MTDGNYSKNNILFFNGRANLGSQTSEGKSERKGHLALQVNKSDVQRLTSGLTLNFLWITCTNIHSSTLQQTFRVVHINPERKSRLKWCFHNQCISASFVLKGSLTTGSHITHWRLTLDHMSWNFFFFFFPKRQTVNFSDHMLFVWDTTAHWRFSLKNLNVTFRKCNNKSWIWIASHVI